MAKLIILAGLPGCGKSSYAEAFIAAKNIFPDTKTSADHWAVHSSDAIREELFGDASCQADNNRVFETMHKRVKADLEKGINVIYDATNVTRKSRRSAIALAGKHDLVECHIVWAPINVCVDRDAQRDRTVGKEVIEKFVRRWQSPFYDEGFSDIIIVSKFGYEFDRSHYISSMTAQMHIPHDNPHHTLGVYEHCMEAYQQLKANEVAPHVVRAATYWHDVGKPFTKGYKNKPDSNEIDYSVAHYYDHQNVGAYMAYGLYSDHEMGNSFIVQFSWLINNHMEPFFNSKYYQQLPENLKKQVDMIHKYDRIAH